MFVSITCLIVLFNLTKVLHTYIPVLLVSHVIVLHYFISYYQMAECCFNCLLLFYDLASQVKASWHKYIHQMKLFVREQLKLTCAG